jgi:hypothetical protein
MLTQLCCNVVDFWVIAVWFFNCPPVVFADDLAPQAFVGESATSRLGHTNVRTCMAAHPDTRMRPYCQWFYRFTSAGSTNTVRPNATISTSAKRSSRRTRTKSKTAYKIVLVGNDWVQQFPVVSYGGRIISMLAYKATHMPQCICDKIVCPSYSFCSCQLNSLPDVFCLFQVSRRT